MARRRMTRIHRKSDTAQIDKDLLERQYNETKHIFKHLIIKSEKMQWKKLCHELVEDIWGQGYKIATRQLKGLTPYNPSLEQEIEVINCLFRERYEAWLRTPIMTAAIPFFTSQEIEGAVVNIKPGTASGPDRIPPEAIVVAGVEVLTHLQVRQEFPRVCKEALMTSIRRNTPPDARQHLDQYPY